MAGLAVVLLCVFLGLTGTTTAQLDDTTTVEIIGTVTDEPSTLPTTELTTENPCIAEWNVTVFNNFTIRWNGADREATVYVNIVSIETYGEQCLKNNSFPADFNDKEAPPVLQPPCFNSEYQVDLKLQCGGEEDPEYSTKIRTAPDAPSNVHATNVASSSFRVSWDKPPGTIEEYKVKVDSVESTTTVTYLYVKYLDALTEYKVQVSAKNSREWGKWSEEIPVKTKKIELPTPQNLRSLIVTNTTIKAAWDEVRLESYPIAYCLRIGFNTTGTKLKEKGINTTATSFTIKLLKPYTEYFIRVRALTIGATGNWTETLAVTTLPGVPSEPEDFAKIGEDSVSIKVHWKEPTPSTGPIEFYTVEWAESENLLEVQQAKTTSTVYTIEGLIPLTSYDISVSAATDAGMGNWTPIIQAKTEAPVPPENFKKVASSSTSISLEWTVPKIYGGRDIIVAYSVRWNKLGYANTFTLNTTNLSMTIDGLEPKTKYKFEVQGWTEKGSGDWSHYLSLETGVGVPDPPERFSVGNVYNTSIEVKWDISKRYKDLVALHTVEWKKMDNGPTNIVNTTKLSHIIENLESFTNYSIRVKSWTEDGDGEWAGPLVVQTAIGIPLVPENIKQDVTNTSILVKWNEPFPSRGPIETYFIKWQKGSSEPVQNYSDFPYYLIKELTPYKIYSIQVSAKTEAGFGDWSEPIKVRTKAGIPFQPRNIKAAEVTNTTISVKWDEPSPVRGPIEIYFIEWQEEGSATPIQNTTTVTSYLMDKLTPCRKYFIKVSAKTEAGVGNWSNLIAVSTNTGLPMVPKNVRIFLAKAESLEIRWQEPEPHMGDIVSYSIRWGKRGHDLQSNAVTNGTSYIIENLSAYTWYSVQVRATTNAGDGEWSMPVEGMTDIGIPSVPRDFQEKTNRTTNTSIEVEWKEPIPANGPEIKYTVRWTNLASNFMKSSITSKTTYAIKDLVPYTNYSVEVRAATEAGFGNWTDALVIRTETGVPSKPRNIKSVPIKETSIHMKWEEPVPMVGYITHYYVEWTDTSTNSTITEKVENLYYVITNLSAYRIYSIKIRAETCAGVGNWSTPVIVRTLSGVPLPPKNLEKGDVTNLTICIKWKEPSPFKGPISLYNVRWQHTVSKKINTASTNTSSYCIQKLKPYTWYEVDVQAKTDAGFGAWSESKKIQTAVGIPTVVKQVKSYNETAWTIYLTWSPPDPPNGPLQDYEVKWGERLKPESMRNLTKDTFFVAENLTPFTNYTFKVSASTKVGFGPPSDPVTVQTEITVPSAPINVELVSATNISILLKWKRPVAPNGPITGYTVKWKSTYGEDYPQVAEVKSILQHNITGLLPYENYSIQVSAKTSVGSGPWSDTLVASTKIGVPKPAQISSISVENSRSVSLEWSTVNPYPGPTTYVIQVWRKPTQCNPGSDAVLETTKEGTRGSGEWWFRKPDTIEGLTPYSEYYVRILLNTSVDGSVSSNSSVVKTPPDSPGAPWKVEAECSESTETVVRWKKPQEPNGKIIEYLVRYGVEKSGWDEEVIFVEDECQKDHSLTLTNLRPERKYKIYVRAKAENVEENGAEGSIKGYCVLPAGIPPVGDINSVNIQGSGPHTLGLEWNKNIFSDNMGDITHYAVIVGVSEAVGNSTSGRIAETLPSWSNYSGGFTSFYQATPLEWNPFDEEQEDPLRCEEIKSEEPERKLRCKIGVDKECSSANPYCNGPLKPDTRYGVKLRAFTRGGFSETDPFYTITDPIKEPSSIVGVVVGVVIVFLMLSAFIAFTLILKRKGKLVELRLSILARFGRQPTAPQMPAEQVLQLEACPTTVPLTIHNFADHVRLMMSDSHLRFSQEFETLKKNSPKYPCSAAEMDENRPKNRWLNIFPYDHSRVKLLPLGDEPGSDFVNANYVPGYSSLREYIATQGPLANTVDDFWRMVWEQSVSMIVMLTQCVERGKNKCEQYWPMPGEAKHYGDMQVRTISESMLSSYIIRLFHVQLGSQERRVKQMHFTHWPDFGCPECPDDLINFIRAVRDHLPRFKPGPIVVHCSAGVGRTGTFMAVDRLSQQLRNTDTIDIFGTVMDLRHHRINMVQTEDQYIYIHLCVKQLVDDINRPQESEYEEAIYSNIGMEKDTGV